MKEQMLEIDEWPSDAATKKEFIRRLKGEELVLFKCGGKVHCLGCSVEANELLKANLIYRNVNGILKFSRYLCSKCGKEQLE